MEKENRETNDREREDIFIIKKIEEEVKRAKKYLGEEKVFDFTLGIPTSPISQKVLNIIKKASSKELKKINLEKVIVKEINKEYEYNNKNKIYTEENIIMTYGATEALKSILNNIVEKDDEVIVITPYFAEYRQYVENCGGKLITAKSKINFQIDFVELEKRITQKTKAIIINSPNNPTGVIYSEETIGKLGEILEYKNNEFNKTIYLISDEPYREIVYNNKKVPNINNYYKNTFIINSYSKYLAISGVRIAYIVLNNEMYNGDVINKKIRNTNNYVKNVDNAYIEHIIKEIIERGVGQIRYKKNKELICKELIGLNIEFTEPEGGFYIFIKNPIGNDEVFCDISKKYDIFFLPGLCFGYNGYIRISYCMEYEQLKKALTYFRKIIEEVKKEK